MHDSTNDLAEAIVVSPQMDTLFAERDDILLRVRLAAETQAVRAAEPRVDTKGGALLSLCSGLLVAGLALLGTGKLTGPAAVPGWIAAGLLGAAVVLLSIALRPNLGGGFGFVCFARLATDEQLLTVVANDLDSDGDDTLRQARQLRWLSRSLLQKFTRVRTAQTLLVAALAVAAIAAALAALGR